MLSIYTYPNNENTGYIDPLYYGSSSLGNETGYYKRIKDVSNGTYKPFATGQYEPWNGLYGAPSFLINATGKFYKAVDVESGLENLQMYDYWHQPLATLGTLGVTLAITGSTIGLNYGSDNASVDKAQGYQVSTGDRVELTNFDGALSEWNDTELYVHVISTTELGLSLLQGSSFGLEYWDEIPNVDVNSLGLYPGAANPSVPDTVYPNVNDPYWQLFGSYLVTGVMSAAVDPPNAYYTDAPIDFNTEPTGSIQEGLRALGRHIVTQFTIGSYNEFPTLSDVVFRKREVDAPWVTIDDIIKLPNGEYNHADFGTEQPYNIQGSITLTNNATFTITNPVANTNVWKLQKSDNLGNWADGISGVMSNNEFDSGPVVPDVNGGIENQFAGIPPGGYNVVIGKYGSFGSAGNNTSGVGHGFGLAPLYDSENNHINPKRGDWAYPSNWNTTNASGSVDTEYRAYWAMTSHDINRVPYLNPANNNPASTEGFLLNPDFDNNFFQPSNQTKAINLTNSGYPSNITPGTWFDPANNPAPIVRGMAPSSYVNAHNGTAKQGANGPQVNVNFNFVSGTTEIDTIDVMVRTDAAILPEWWDMLNTIGYQRYTDNTQGTNNILYVDFVKDSDPTQSIGACIQPIEKFYNTTPPTSPSGVTLNSPGTNWITIRCSVMNPRLWDSEFSGTTLNVDLSGNSIGQSWTQSDWVAQTYNGATNEYDSNANYNMWSVATAAEGVPYFKFYNGAAQTFNIFDNTEPNLALISEFTLVKANVSTTLWNCMRTGTLIVANGTDTFYAKFKEGTSSSKTFTIHNNILLYGSVYQPQWNTVGSIVNQDLASCYTDGASYYKQQTETAYYHWTAINQNPTNNPSALPTEVLLSGVDMRWIDLPTVESAGTATIGNSDTTASTTGDIQTVVGYQPATNATLFFGGDQKYQYRTGESTYANGAILGDTYYEVNDATPYLWSQVSFLPGAPVGAVGPVVTVQQSPEGYISGFTITSTGLIPPGDKMLTFDVQPDAYTPPVPTPAEAQDVFDTQDQWASDSATVPDKEWPIHVTPMSAEVNYNAPTIVNNSQSGIKYTRSAAHTKWQLDVVYPPMTATDFKTFHAIAQAAHGQSTPFKFLLKDKTGGPILWKDLVDSTTSTLYPRFASGVVGGDTLSLFGGFNSNEPNAFMQGEVFIDGENENGRLHTALSGTGANVYGEAKIRTPWPFRSDVPAGTAIAKNPEYAVVTLGDDNFMWSVDVNNYYYVSVSFALDSWK